MSRDSDEQCDRRAGGSSVSQWNHSRATRIYSIARARMGQGLPQDYEQAVIWYSEAAEQGSDYAQYNLGVCYRDGYGLAQDVVEAAKWFLRAAVQGNDDAQSDLGHCYLSGKGTAQDPIEAVKWFAKAAAKGHPRGQLSLARCYSDGKGVGPDCCEAYKWFKLAANNKANEAYKWFRASVSNTTETELSTREHAAERGRKYAADELAALSSTMSSDELEEGERRYREFRANQ